MKKLKAIALCALLAVVTLAIGMALGSHLQTKRFINAILHDSLSLDAQLSDCINNFFPEPAYGIAEPYPVMSEEEKASFLSENKEFYDALESGSLLVNPYILQYLYADNAGNNPIVLSIIEDFSSTGNSAHGEHGEIVIVPNDGMSGETFAEVAQANYQSKVSNTVGNQKLAILRTIFNYWATEEDSKTLAPNKLPSRKRKKSRKFCGSFSIAGTGFEPATFGL